VGVSIVLFAILFVVERFFLILIFSVLFIIIIIFLLFFFYGVRCCLQRWFEFLLWL
jgi:hypothetical protein